MPEKKTILDINMNFVKCPDCKAVTVITIQTDFMKTMQLGAMDGFLKPGCVHGLVRLLSAFISPEIVEALLRYLRVLEKFGPEKPRREGKKAQALLAASVAGIMDVQKLKVDPLEHRKNKGVKRARKKG